MAARLRTQVFSALMQQETTFFDDPKVHGVTAVLDSDIRTLQATVTDKLPASVGHIISVLACLGFIFAISWKLTIVMIALAPVAAFAQVASSRVQSLHFAKVADALDTSNIMAEESVALIKTVRVCMKEGEQSRDYNERVSAVWRLSRSAAMYKGGLQGASMLAMSGCVVMGLWYGGLLVIRGPQELSTGQLTAYILYVIYSVFAITQLIATINSNAAAASAAARVGEILNRRPLAAVERGQALTNFRGLIEFKNVHFSHPQQPDRPSLSGLTFTCRPSTITSIVGPSSCGKSVVPMLLARLYDIQGGKICVDMKDIETYDSRSLRAHLSYVSSEPALFSMSVASNIAYSCPNPPSMSDIVAAARLANAHDFISALPDGYKTEIGDDGVGLTSDQRFRINVARAVLKNAPLLLINEGNDTDFESQRNAGLAHAAIDKLISSSNRTVIAISHRLHILQQAADIVVMEEGKAVAHGTFEQLKSKPGFVSSLLDRIQQNQSEDPSGTLRNTAGVSLENALLALEVACDGDGGAQGHLAALRASFAKRAQPSNIVSFDVDFD